ncbi:hypothetical protein BDV19DRAFT_366039 [Aspergillus venezuelensis]
MLLKSLLALANLAPTTLGGSTIECFSSCSAAPSSDCYDAFAQIPTAGTVSSNSNTKWTSSSCTFTFFPDGVKPMWRTSTAKPSPCLISVVVKSARALNLIRTLRMR